MADAEEEGKDDQVGADQTLRQVQGVKVIDDIIRKVLGLGVVRGVGAREPLAPEGPVTELHERGKHER